MAIVNNSETQLNSTYTVEFYAESNSYPLSSYPDSYLQIEIYDEDSNLYHTVTNLSPETVYPYTFNSNDVGEYDVVYTIFASPEAANEDYDIETVPFTVYEYKPTFSLPTITCAELGNPFNFFPTNWNQNENDLCPVNPLDAEIKYERYEFDLTTSTYVKKDEEVLTITEDGAVTGQDYAYKIGAWIPNKLAMVKFVVTVTNCSASIEKSTVFPICGAWKIRRMSCGNYRIYNYKNSNINYSLFKGVDVNNSTPIITNISIPPFTFVNIDPSKMEDGVYRVVADNVTQYIFNFCTIEECMLNLYKKVLLDDELCDECKMDKVLYQKALRLISVYETWKKLLDKNWVYDMQYQNTDIDGNLSAIYDAEELYAELLKICDSCNTPDKKCRCK
jgi:hypothetical protein